MLKRHSMLNLKTILLMQKLILFKHYRTYPWLGILKKGSLSKTEEYLERAAELLPERQPIEADLEEAKKTY